MTRRSATADKETFPEALGALLHDSDLTVTELAAVAEINDQTIRNYLAGTRTPRRPILRKLEDALHDEDGRLRRALGVDSPRPKTYTFREGDVDEVFRKVRLIDDLLRQHAEMQAEIRMLRAELDELQGRPSEGPATPLRRQR